jgi:hypothetical protein
MIDAIIIVISIINITGLSLNINFALTFTMTSINRLTAEMQMVVMNTAKFIFIFIFILVLVWVLVIVDLIQVPHNKALVNAKSHLFFTLSYCRWYLDSVQPLKKRQNLRNFISVFGSATDGVAVVKSAMQRQVCEGGAGLEIGNFVQGRYGVISQIQRAQVGCWCCR